MKKVINGKRYDTDKAEVVADWSNGHYGNDFRQQEETLYKTASGAYFLHGCGGAMSEYSERVGNMTAGSEDIIPMTRESAINWCESRQCVDALESEFEDAVTDA